MKRQVLYHNYTIHIMMVLFFCGIVFGVDRGNFKTCEQSSFCKRQREFSPHDGKSQFHVHPASVSATASATGISASLIDEATGRNLSLRIVRMTGGAFRIHLSESSRRFEIPEGDALLPNLAEIPTQLSRSANDSNFIRLDSGGNSASLVVQLRPFRADLMLDNRAVVSVNSRGLLNWEFLGLAAHTGPEKFRDHEDSRPRGPASIGADVAFPCAARVFGIPEHADQLPLRSTVGGAGDPYRLYNLDVFEYELDSRMALYGSVPVMYGHSVNNATVGAFWHNAAETWVDIGTTGGGTGGIDTRWFSESGVIDLFLLAGPTPLSAIAQFAALVGTTPLPPIFALGYHQSKWNYNDEADVIEVNRRFNEADFPYDTLWLDIEHTDGKRCFTWDSAKFPNPQSLIDHLAESGRKLVTIVDPHVKRDDAWSVYKEVRDRGMAVKKPSGSEFDGWCWPGSSVWPDFINPDVQSWWSQQFLSYPAAYTWNDMNEPSVFSGPEITMPKDLTHSGGWEHRDVHNIYGALVHKASWAGQLLRSPDKRPFVLTRALFAGSQRTAATWTGDNAAKWSHLKASEPMLMSLGLGGITFAGADVGGFFGDPDPELLTRWYQAGSMQPFFRAHAHLDSKRREPWLFAKPYSEAMRSAVLLRYSLLPYIYTQFYISQSDGRPVMAPLWVYHPNDAGTLDIDDQHLLGQDLLFKPVTEAGVKQVSVYLPKSSSWYLYGSWQHHAGGAWVSVPVSIATSPLFMRAGAIVPRREIRPGRRSAESTLSDPLSLIVLMSPDPAGSAIGTLYLDDGRSRIVGNHSNSIDSFLLVDFAFANGVLVCRTGVAATATASFGFVESVAFVGVPARPAGARLQRLRPGGGGTGGWESETADFRYDSRNRAAVVRGLHLPFGGVRGGWRLRLMPPAVANADGSERDEL